MKQSVLRLGCDAGEKGHELGIVIEHLFEMRDEPDRIDGIARKAAAQMVIDATLTDMNEGRHHRLGEALVAAALRHGPEKGEDRHLREFRRAFEPAMIEIDCAQKSLSGVAGEIERQSGLALRLCRLAPEGGKDRAGVGRDLVAFIAPDAPELFQNMAKAWPAIERFLWKISPAPERISVGRQEHRQRPTALLAQ